MNAILAFVSTYSTYFSIGSLALSVFFAGSLLQGERMRTQEIRAELEELAQINESTMARVDQINATLRETDARLVEEISERYDELMVLDEEEEEVRTDLAETNTQIQDNRQEQDGTVENLRSNTGFQLRPRPTVVSNNENQ